MGIVAQHFFVKMRPPLLFVHGMMETGGCWKNYRSVFESAGFECHAPDLRYHHLSQKDAPDYRLGTVSLRDYVADLKALVATLPTAPVLVGHSMGGLIVQLLASEVQARAVVALTPAPPSNITSFAISPLRIFAESVLSMRFWEKPFKVSFASASFGFLHQLPLADQQKGYSEMVYESGRVLSEIALPQFDKHKAAHVPIDKVTCPILFVGASLDRATPAVSVKKASKLYPQGEYKEYAQFGHWVLGEAGWEQVPQDILAWLQPHV
ncbi:MAG: alpha/beta hydrolase [Bacteroidetes bacterium]|nr:MAG: alpha/beta hydrolase [Bacteroidota bacterium]